MDEGLGWRGQIERVGSKLRQLLGVLGRARSVLGGQSLLSLYNGLVLPHLQYCLMVWGDFEGCRNGTRGDALLRCQKQFARMISGRVGGCHSSPLFAQHGMLRVGDLYRQQLRVHGWRFWNRQLPENQAAMLSRTGDVHGHATRFAGSGLYLSTRDHRSVGYRVPTEWAVLSAALRGVGSLAAFKRGSRGGFWVSMGRLCVGRWGVGFVGGEPWTPDAWVFWTGLKLWADLLPDLWSLMIAGHICDSADPCLIATLYSVYLLS